MRGHEMKTLKMLNENNLISDAKFDEIKAFLGNKQQNISNENICQSFDIEQAPNMIKALLGKYDLTSDLENFSVSDDYDFSEYFKSIKQQSDASRILERNYVVDELLRPQFNIEYSKMQHLVLFVRKGSTNTMQYYCADVSRQDGLNVKNVAIYRSDEEDFRPIANKPMGRIIDNSKALHIHQSVIGAIADISISNDKYDVVSGANAKRLLADNEIQSAFAGNRVTLVPLNTREGDKWLEELLRKYPSAKIKRSPRGRNLAVYARDGGDLQTWLERDGDQRVNLSTIQG